MSAGDLSEVIHVTSPVDAFKALQNEDIGVILAARKLGSMDLTHLLCLLKRQHPQIVSIVLTETSDTALVCQLINQGQIFRLIAKPVKAGELRLALKSALSKRHELLDDPLLAARYQVEPLGEDAEHLLHEQLAGRAPPEAPPLPAGPCPTRTKPLTGFVGHFMRRLFRS
jgi:serine/threonine-protein kinase